MELVKFQVKDRVATIRINRPEKRNALNHELVSELGRAFSAAEADDKVKVVVLTGTGDVFCAGADLKYLQDLQAFSREENIADSRHLMNLFRQIYVMKKVVIAKVNGHAIAGGCGLVSVCDFAYAVPEANFGYTEVRIGFIPAIVMSFLLRKTGETRAKELLLSGKIIHADTAEKYGLINAVIDEKEIGQAVADIANNLCEQNSGQAMGLTKEMIRKVQDMPLQDALDYAVQMNAEARASEDCKRGIASFLNKEKLKW